LPVSKQTGKDFSILKFFGAAWNHFFKGKRWGVVLLSEGCFLATFLLPPCWFVAAGSRKTAREQQGNSKKTVENQAADAEKRGPRFRKE